MIETTILLSDQSLIAAYVASADQAAFSQLVSRHWAMVYRICRSYVGQADAEDCTQATFLIVMKKAATLKESSSFVAWLCTIARNVSLRAVSDRKTRARKEQEAIEMNQQTDTHSIKSHVDVSMVYACLEDLSLVQRQAVVLRHLEGHSEKEAAEIANCSVDALSRRASDGMAKLRLRLAKRGVAIGAMALVTLLQTEANAAVPATLLPAILGLSSMTANGVVVSTVSSSVTSLAKGTLSTMFYEQVKAAAFAAALVFAIATPVTFSLLQNRMATAVSNPALDTAVSNIAPLEINPPQLEPTPQSEVVTGFVRPAVDPQLLINLDRVIELPPMARATFTALTLAVTHALPPLERVNIRVLSIPGDISTEQFLQLREKDNPAKSQHEIKVEEIITKPIAMKGGETSLRTHLDQYSLATGMQWFAADDTVVFFLCRCQKRK